MAWRPTPIHTVNTMDPVTVKDNVNATTAPGTEVLKTPHVGCEGLPAHPNAVAADHVQVHAQPPVPTPQTDGLEILGNTDTVAVAQHMVENVSSPPMRRRSAPCSSNMHFTSDCRSFNRQPAILKPAADLLPPTKGASPIFVEMIEMLETSEHPNEIQMSMGCSGCPSTLSEHWFRAGETQAWTKTPQTNICSCSCTYYRGNNLHWLRRAGRVAALLLI